MTRLCWMSFVVALAGCPAPATPAPDAGTRALRFATAPAPPAPPDAAVLTPCPAGWREVRGDGGDPTTCDPWPEGGPSACAADEAHFPGEAGCLRVGTACTADDWADGLPTSGVLFVRAGAPDGGVGARAAPFGTIAQALAVASAGTTIALSKGSYSELVSLPGAVTLWGACTAQTTLVAPSPARGGTVQAMGPGAVLKNVRVSGPRSAAWVSRSGTSLELDSVIADRAAGVAVIAGGGGGISGHEVVIRDTQLYGGSGGWAVDAEASGNVQLSRVVISGSTETAVVASGPGSIVSLTDAAIRHTRARPDGQLGYGVLAHASAQLGLTRVVVEDAQAFGVIVGGSAGTLTDVVVRDTVPAASDTSRGGGLLAEGGASLTVTRALVERNRAEGVMIRDAQTQARLRSLVVRDTAVEASTGEDGQGLFVQDGAQVQVAQAFFGRSHRNGVVAVTGEVSLTDVEIVETSDSAPSLFDGAGLQLSLGARVALERVRIAASERVGVLVSGAGSALSGVDVIVRDTRCNGGNGQEGLGVVVQAGGALSLSRFALTRNATAALQLSDPGSTALLEDLTIDDTTADARGAWGRGMQVQGSARLTVNRGLVSGNADVGVFVLGGASAELDGVAIWDTAKSPCVLEGRCPDVGGIGVVSAVDAGVRLTHFELVNAAVCGLEIGEGGVADLETGLVAQNPIGVAVLDEGFDLARLSSGVVYESNGTRLSTRALAVPVPYP